MKLQNILFAVLAITSCTLTAHADLPAGEITVAGTVEKPGTWTADRLSKELASDVATINYTSHGQKHVAVAVPLLSVLKASGLQTQLKSDPKANPKVKHFELRLAVTVQGNDGYVATFSLAELQPDLGHRHVWLVLEADGQPLPAAEGPIKLISSDDEKPARWVHSVQSICVVDAAQPSTKPAG